MEHPSLMLHYAARSHVGLVRAKNDDSAYVGRYLAVVADGMGGHAGGDVASASTVLDLIHLDRSDYDGDAGTHLADEIQSANSLLSELVQVNPKLAGMGTTVTSLLMDGDRLAYAHIGDSRAYRLKDGVYEQMSTDHTFVQRMIEEGRMTEAEAEVHPHKNVLMRVLGDVDASPELDLRYFDAEAGERWLLCSDGLNFVRPNMVEEVVRNSADLATAADTLIELTLAAGSPDNVTVVVFDVVPWTEEPAPASDSETTALPVLTPENPDSDSPKHPDSDSPETSELTLDAETEVSEDGSPELEKSDEESAAEDSGEKAEASSEELDAHIRAAVVLEELSKRPHELVGAAVTANAQGKIPSLSHHPSTRRAATALTHKPTSVPVDSEHDSPPPNTRLRRIIMWSVAALAVVALVVGGAIAYAWTQTQYFVGTSNGNVAIYQGVSQKLGPITLSHLQRETSVRVSSLPEYSKQLVASTMPASSLSAAEQIISDLQLGTGVSTPPCELPPTQSPTPFPSSTSSSTAKPEPSPSAKPGQTASATATPSIPQETLSPTCIPGGGR